MSRRTQWNQFERAIALPGTGSRELTARFDLDGVLDWRGTPVTVRWVLMHMVRELARHAGHGDILVEQLHARRDV